jgi:hypothetical protein
MMIQIMVTSLWRRVSTGPQFGCVLAREIASRRAQRGPTSSQKPWAPRRYIARNPTPVRSIPPPNERIDLQRRRARANAAEDANPTWVRAISSAEIKRAERVSFSAEIKLGRRIGRAA